MSIWNKVDNAKPTTWLVDGMTQEEVRECIDNGKIKCAVLKALKDVRAEIQKVDRRYPFHDNLTPCVDEGKVIEIIDNKIAEVKGE